MLFLKNKKSKLIFGLLFIIAGIVCFFCKYGISIYKNIEEEKKLDDFYDFQEEIVKEENIINETESLETQIDYSSSYNDNYIAVINIPKIDLEKGLCALGTSCNNVDYNIQILDDSDYPDVENGNLILAGHSGNLSVSYFKNVYKLTEEDIITITYNGYIYKYKVVNIYDIPKTGMANIMRNKNKTTLTLITCRKGTDNQIVVVSELIERINYNE